MRGIGHQQGLAIPAADLVLPESEDHEPAIVPIGLQAVEEQGVQIFGTSAGRQPDREDGRDRYGQFIQLRHHRRQGFRGRRPIGACHCPGSRTGAARMSWTMSVYQFLPLAS